VSDAPSGGHGRDGARAPAWMAPLALAAVVAVFYHRLWLPGLILIKQDAYRFFLPLKRYMVERLSEGELPQWFPYESLGRPFLGVPGTGVFHPFTALYFVFSIADAYRLSVLLSCLAGAVGAFAYGRLLGLSQAGAAFAGLAFACSGYAASLTQNVVYLYSACLLPLFCASLHRALRAGGAWLAAPAVLWATVFLQGDIQTGYYYGFIALLQAALHREGPFRTAGLRLCGIAALAGLLAAVQLAPAGALFLDSHRAHAARFHEQAMDWSTHPLRVLTLAAGLSVAPDDEILVAHYFFGGKPPDDAPVGFWSESLYLGLPVVGLAAIGIRHRRDLLWLSALGGLALWLALGKYGGLYELCYQVVPLWSAFRFPEKILAVGTFAVAMLAGAGFDEMRSGRGYPRAWAGAAVLCFALAALLSQDRAGMTALAWFNAPEPLVRSVGASFAQGWAFSAAAAAGVGLTAMGMCKHWAQARLLAVALLSVAALDLSRVNQEAYHTGPAAAATFTPALAEAIRRHAGVEGPGHFRILPLEYSYLAFPLAIRQSLDGAGITSVVNRQALVVEHNADVGLESVGSYLPGQSETLSKLYAALAGEVRLDVYARLNVAYVVGQQEFFRSPEWTRSFVAAVPDYELVAAANPVPPSPRAYLSARPEPTDGTVDPSAWLIRPDFLRDGADLVEAHGMELPEPAREGRTTIERYRPEDVVIRVSNPKPAVLVLLDAFEQGWTARLDDANELPVLRANGLVRAVIVPAGDHRVTFAYRTPWLTAGMLLSMIGLAICLALCVPVWRASSSASKPKAA
jgi:hypothetical protein